jgi:hypothetical protein
MKKLPPEITDRIVDFLHSDSSALSACSLVCKSWLPGSRHHLFKRLVFSPTHKARPLQGPVDVSVARTIAPYVHQVHIFEDDRLEWVNTVLPHLEITNFKEVKSLLLSSMNYKSDPSAAATLHALRVCFPGVTRLRLDTVFFDTFPRVLELICVFPELEVVHLENVRLRDDRPIVEPLPGQPNPLPHLRSLLLEDYIILSNLWNWCRSYGNLPSVDNLSLVVRKGRVSAIARVLKDLGGALKRLSIGFDFEPTTDGT